jgi:hypothetical protein
MTGHNHYPDCSCGWCVNYGRSRINRIELTESIRYRDAKVLLKQSGANSVSACYARCPVCREPVFFYANTADSRVFVNHHDRGGGKEYNYMSAWKGAPDGGRPETGRIATFDAPTQMSGVGAPCSLRSRKRTAGNHPFIATLTAETEPLLSGKRQRGLDDRNGEGFRVPSGVRKPLMQEPAVGIL